MIKFSSSHRCDQLDFEDEWTNRRQKNRHTFKEKCIYSLKKICDENLDHYRDESIIDDIKTNFLKEEDKDVFDE